MRFLAWILIGGVATAATGAAAPILTLDRTSLSFAAPTGGPNPPPQIVRISNTGDKTLEWDAEESTSWLTLSPAEGELKRDASVDLTVSVNAAGLTTGTYTASFSVKGDDDTQNTPQTVSVTFAVNVLPTLSTSPPSLAFSEPVGGPDPASQTVTVSNSGAGVLSWSASDDQTWLSVSPGSGTLSAGASQSLAVSVQGASLPAGLRTGTVTVTATGASGSPKSIAVTLNVNAVPTIGVSPPSLAFQAAEGGAAPASQSLLISNTGSGTLSWSASENGAWLSLAPASGTVAAGSSATIPVSAAPTGLLDGTYLATITITAAGASNSPRTVPVSLVISSGARIALNPVELSFSSFAGSPPPTQAISVTNTGAGMLTWTASDDGGWLVPSPSSGTLNGVQSQPVTLSVDPSSLQPGIYTALLTVADPTASNGSKTVYVTLDVASPPPSNDQSAGGCGLLGLEVLLLALLRWVLSGPRAKFAR